MQRITLKENNEIDFKEEFIKFEMPKIEIRNKNESRNTKQKRKSRNETLKCLNDVSYNRISIICKFGFLFSSFGISLFVSDFEFRYFGFYPNVDTCKLKVSDSRLKLAFPVSTHSPPLPRTRYHRFS